MTELIAEVQDFLKALAGETRQRILFLFVDGQERTVSQVAQEADIGQSTASEHLAVLKGAGLLQACRVGKEVYYRPDPKRCHALLQKLSELISRCCPPE